jgi:arylsulfatase A-like enzyme
VDLLPTLCDFAGIEIPEGLPGRSLKPIALGMAPEEHRTFVVVSNHMVQCEPVDGLLLQPEGRMVRSRRYKYCVYSEGKRRESLVDMETDPHEMVNLAGNPEHREALARHRRYLREFARVHRDATARALLEALSATPAEAGTR